nr:phosphatase PAP2 family protein [Nocardioides sambongensis]
MATTPSRSPRRRLRVGLRELGLLLALYLGYSAVRMVASDDFMRAVLHAEFLLDLERPLGIAREHLVNDYFHAHRWLEVAASFYYAVAHYLVTAVVLGWLWFRRHSFYPVARTALAVASLVALAGFLLLPTAPPRLFGGYQDLLAQTADVGWWSDHASAPQDWRT